MALSSGSGLKGIGSGFGKRLIRPPNQKVLLANRVHASHIKWNLPTRPPPRDKKTLICCCFANWLKIDKIESN